MNRYTIALALTLLTAPAMAQTPKPSAASLDQDYRRAIAQLDQLQKQNQSLTETNRVFYQIMKDLEDARGTVVAYDAALQQARNQLAVQTQSVTAKTQEITAATKAKEAAERRVTQLEMSQKAALDGKDAQIKALTAARAKAEKDAGDAKADAATKEARIKQLLQEKAYLGDKHDRPVGADGKRK